MELLSGQVTRPKTQRMVQWSSTWGRCTASGSNFRYEMSVQPDDETLKHLESRGKIYGEEEKKRQAKKRRCSNRARAF